MQLPVNFNSEPIKLKGGGEERGGGLKARLQYGSFKKVLKQLV